MAAKGVLHSLNALRVIAEVLVVRLHLLHLVGDRVSVWYDIFAHDLLCFFFVLSGFVAAHSHRDVEQMDWGASGVYWVTRWSKTYPVYAVWVTVNLAGVFMHGGASQCSWFWPCVVGDYLLLSPWMFCQSVVGVGVAWYLSTLGWLWLAFPFLHSHGAWLRRNPWTGMGLCYSLSLPLWGIGVVHPSAAGGGSPTSNLSRFPLLRVCEFLVGYCAAFVGDGVPWLLLPAACAVHVGQYAFDVVVTEGYTLCVLLSEGSSTCYLWGPQSPPSVSCVPVWDQYWSRTALVWGVLLVHCARWEALSEEGVPFLNHQVWRDLSGFSLQMYLGHFSVGAILVSAAQWAGVPEFWHVDTLLAACYALNYGFSRVVQPSLDRLARWLCGLPAAPCSVIPLSLGL
jgi:peptidoglycan/LPS O-acetylase OafA/YrhL